MISKDILANRAVQNTISINFSNLRIEVVFPNS
jgi:hypothetical protein